MIAVRKVDVEQGRHQSEEDRYLVSLVRGGKPVAGIKLERIADIEEKVMQWEDANHIHGWFVDNVQNGKNDYGTYHVSQEKLCKLLETCEQVLQASHLVRKSIFKEKDYWANYFRADKPLGSSTKVIKNVALAHRLLPTRSFSQYDGANEYNEAYLKAVEATRDWAESTLTDMASKVPGSIYYSSHR